MSFKVLQSHLQQEEYGYTWSRDKGDSRYTGELDRIKIDKDEGYEVLHFIQRFMDLYGLTTEDDVHKVENALHMPRLSNVVLRNTLITEIALYIYA